MSSIALDTHILVALFSKTDVAKREIADRLVSLNPIVGSQVVSEFLNVSKRLLQLPKLDIINKCNLVFELCIIVSTTQTILYTAAHLIKRYDLQLFDSIIIAIALQAGCITL